VRHEGGSRRRCRRQPARANSHEIPQKHLLAALSSQIIPVKTEEHALKKLLADVHKHRGVSLAPWPLCELQDRLTRLVG